MKLHLTSAFVALVALASPAFAQTQSNAGSDSRAMAIIDNSQPAMTRSKGRLDTTASAIAPGLTAAGVHSCAGSTSAAGGGTGFGFSFGTTYEMQECNRRAYAATLMGMGQNAAALALVCNNSEVQNALNLTGVVCPQQRQQQVAAQQVQAAYSASRGSQGSVVTSRGEVLRSATPWRD